MSCWTAACISWACRTVFSVGAANNTATAMQTPKNIFICSRRIFRQFFGANGAPHLNALLWLELRKVPLVAQRRKLLILGRAHVAQAELLKQSCSSRAAEDEYLGLP